MHYTNMFLLMSYLRISKISDVTIEFLVLCLVERNRLSCDSYLARGGNYHMSLEIVLQKEVAERDWKFLLNKLSYSFQSPVESPFWRMIFNNWRNNFSKWRLYFYTYQIAKKLNR